jgi:hypothetical protein
MAEIEIPSILGSFDGLRRNGRTSKEKWSLRCALLVLVAAVTLAVFFDWARLALMLYILGLNLFLVVCRQPMRLLRRSGEWALLAGILVLHAIPIIAIVLIWIRFAQIAKSGEFVMDVPIFSALCANWITGKLVANRSSKQPLKGVADLP